MNQIDLESILIGARHWNGLRRTHRISWMISGWIAPVTLGSNGGGTACLSIGCPDDFYAVRLGFANITPDPWKITKVIGCASTTFNDYVRPTGNAQWSSFTFAGKGKDDNRLATRVDAPTEITVFGNTLDEVTGEAGNPAWTWTDWTPIRSVDADPMTGMRVLMLRALVPSQQTICFANSQLRSITGNMALNHGFDYFIGGIKFDFDRVNSPTILSHESTKVWQDNQLASGSLFPIVQFLTRNAGIVGATSGDSHHQGTSTTEQVTNYLYRATTQLGRHTIGKVPFGMVNCAVGGLTSGQFFPRLEALLQAVRPSYAILPSWTYNERSGLIHADQAAVDRFVARLIQTSEVCEENGVLPIFLLPLPRGDGGKMPQTQIDPWRERIKTTLNMKSAGAIVLDATMLLGLTMDGEYDGTYKPQMSDDGAHPNDAGHSVIATNLIALLQTLFK